MLREFPPIYNDLKDSNATSIKTGEQKFQNMAITWRPTTWDDIEPSLSIQPENRSDGFSEMTAALLAWRVLFQSPFFISAVLEANPAIQGHRLIGFGAAVLVLPEFLNQEIAHPHPGLTARIMASVDAGSSVLATRAEVARANAEKGVDLVILHCCWRNSILPEQDRHAVQTIFASSFTEALAGFRVNRILIETTSEFVTAFHRRSPEYEVIAEFPESSSTWHLMTRASATALPGSLGNVIFRFCEPVLRLRESDQELLFAALSGATDSELAVQLGVTFGAVKARWRSVFERAREMMPALLRDHGEQRDGRGAQKRHRVLAYVRSHPEELRPYEWKVARVRPNGVPLSNGLTKEAAAGHDATKI
jgi:hypothetical protein